MNVKAPKSYDDLLTVNGVCSCYKTPYSLRHLFATILIYSNPDRPRELQKQFEDSMPQGLRNSGNSMSHDILHSMGCDINEFNLVPETIKSSKITKEAKEVYFEWNIMVTDGDLL